ncbi:hypothetical protein CRYUN_Cryun16bG0033000 [Craigia yunnanensis]
MNSRGSKELEVKEAEVVAAKANDVELGQKTDWRTCLLLLQISLLSYFPPQKLDGKVVVSPPKDVFEEGVSQWRKPMVAQFIGRIPNYIIW